MNKKNTVIFDFDGTLLNTLDDLMNSANAALGMMGYPTRSKEEIRSFVGNGILVLITKAVPAGTDEQDIQKTLELFNKHYKAHCNDLTKPYDGIDELVDELMRRGIKMAIVSNKGDFAVKDLAEIYFNGRIPVAIGEKESEGIRRKPAPDTVFEALRQLGSSASEAVYVGDSEVDMLTAENSGMDVILCSWGFRGKEFLKKHGANVIIDKPEELLGII